VPDTGALDVRLRDVEHGDLPVFFEHQLDPEACAMAAFQPRDRDAFMVHWTTKILGDEAVVKRTVLFGGRVAGNVVSFDQAGERLVGYWIGREFWGRGIASRALGEFLVHDATRPLRAYVAEHNVASIRVLEKCGFTLVRRQVAEDGVAERLLELREDLSGPSAR
jgi:RimJ/RimL family protein N-acetyltransferase